MLRSITHHFPWAADRSSRLCGWANRARAVFAEAARVVTFWVDRARQRQALAELDGHLLNDIGVSRGNALRESCVPFWR